MLAQLQPELLDVRGGQAREREVDALNAPRFDR